jgi:hypothetical protein
MSTAEYDRLATWFAGHQQAELRLFGDLPPSIDFLESYPTLNSFTMDCSSVALTDATGLRFLPETMRELSIDVKLQSRKDLDVLSRFRALEKLSLGQLRRLPDSVAGLPVQDLCLATVKTLDGIESLADVKTLRLQNVTANLAPLTALRHLADLTLAVGGSSDLTPLREVPSLRRFSAWLVRGLSDVAAVSELPHLEFIHLERLRQVTRLGNLRQSHALTEVRLELLRGLTDLAPLNDAPALRTLWLIDMGHLQAADVAVVAGHGRLAKVHVGLGSDRKNLAVRDALRIPGSYGGWPWP